jgi:hypothetical protein
LSESDFGDLKKKLTEKFMKEYESDLIGAMNNLKI